MNHKFTDILFPGIVILFLLPLFLVGCGYSRQEMNIMNQYCSKAEENARKYINGKYGIDATIVSSSCEKEAENVMDFSPVPTGMVYVTMQYDGKEFVAYVSGAQDSNEGLDNYQSQEIYEAVRQQIRKITQEEEEDCFLYYGNWELLKDDRESMLSTRFDGDNLVEVLSEDTAYVIVNYVDVDVDTLDVSSILKETGIQICVFADYSNKEFYDKVERPQYNIKGSPIEAGIEDYMLFVDGYRKTTIDANGNVTDEYLDYQKYKVDDLIVVLETPEADFSFQKSSMDDTDNWKGHGFHNAERITDAYELQTNADRIHVFCPLDKLGEQTDAEFAVQYKRNGQTNYSSCFTEVTNDKKYLWGTIYSDEYEDIRVALFKDKD